MSPRNFARRFKAATGEAPLAYVHRLRIDTARHYLENAQRSVQEISQRRRLRGRRVLPPALSPPHRDVAARIPRALRASARSLITLARSDPAMV